MVHNHISNWTDHTTFTFSHITLHLKHLRANLVSFDLSSLNLISGWLSYAFLSIIYMYKFLYPWKFGFLTPLKRQEQLRKNDIEANNTRGLNNLWLQKFSPIFILNICSHSIHTTFHRTQINMSQQERSCILWWNNLRVQKKKHHI